MRAIVQHGYGDPGEVLRVEDVEHPAPGDREVLVRVEAASVNAKDWMEVAGHPYLFRLALGPFRPRNPVPGADVAGVVETVGPKVTRWRPGDEVFGELPRGTFAEYALATEDAVAPKPAGLGFAEAAAVPLAGITALQGIRAARVRPGHRVLINGASGGVGTFAVQIAKSQGAHVTGVCRTDALDLVRSIGADDVVDYTEEDFTRREGSYDRILDMVGSHSLADYRRALRSGGRCVVATGMPGGKVLGPLPYLLQAMSAGSRNGSTVTTLSAKPNPEDLAELTRLADAGQLRPAVDRTYELSDAPAAVAAQGAGHARGKTVVTIGGGA
ncbi:NAD(P)-dependent alcohol dehydrogenase [Myceligenerans pegani]|uniref:NAD(P)-dependent alcohol dehydrogenase n=1 Tax=Myceligenerans pegani TaxID=2776917 RepID=A0ABR9MVX4_9MICO|nr:NAD(P)-dependent alcohol dehydrogenase [Myceligenerans sp. TRM 65318]MBE1875536.1 NAD(P)-dependent alcohol dehydrogenase [Myceligenerans sp. TRM 65318]MBE3017807.1 NAD(P)-dependent alcohol dehydrogenase [Myceligenerans sp. TRM 65318]